MLDILICILPKINPDSPTVGPAILKSHLMQAGFSCEVVDLNIKLFNELKSKGKESYYYANDLIFKKFPINIDNRMTPPPEFLVLYEEFEYVFLNWINFIKEKNVKFNKAIYGTDAKFNDVTNIINTCSSSNIVINNVKYRHIQKILLKSWNKKS
jgi:hypothetical protein